LAGGCDVGSVFAAREPVPEAVVQPRRWSRYGPPAGGETVSAVWVAPFNPVSQAEGGRGRAGGGVGQVLRSLKMPVVVPL